jgi:hypothetical protein
MRSGGNFSPEWGYLAPAPSFLRTARIVVAATAVGATAGAAVVLSLIDHPTAEVSTTTAAAHAIVTGAQAVIPPAAATPSTATKDVVAPVKVAAPLPAQSPVTVPAAQNPAAQTIAVQAPATQTPVMPPLQQATQPQTPALGEPAAAAPVDPGAAAPSVAALSEGTPVIAAPEATDAAATAPDAKKKHAGGSKNKQAQGPDLGVMLRHMFTTRSGGR